MKEKRFRYSCHYNVRHPGQCDGQSGYGVTKLDAIVESIVCTKFSEILECSKSKLLQDLFTVGRRLNIFFLLDDLKKPELHQEAEKNLQQILSKNPDVDFAALCNYVRQSQI